MTNNIVNPNATNPYTQQGAKLYREAQSVGGFVVPHVLVLTKADVEKENWPHVRRLMLENIHNLYEDAIQQVEDDLRDAQRG